MTKFKRQSEEKSNGRNYLQRAPQSSSASFRHIQNGWIWEILAALFSFVCLVIIIAVLKYEDGRTMDDWNLLVTPNTLISIIGAVAKSAFMLAIVEIISQLKWLHFHQKPHSISDFDTFDESSRGPLGAAKFLLAKRTSSLLASCAAIITIAALFVDPFLQAVLTYPTRLTRDSAAAAPSFLVTSIFDPNNIFWSSYLGFPDIASNVNTQTQASIISGLYGDEINYQMTCPGNECTWTNVTTLGICGSCNDVLPQVNKKCELQMEDSWPRCNYTLGGGAVVQGVWHVDDDPSSTVWNSTGIGLVDQQYDSFAKNISDVPALLAAFASVKLTNDTSYPFSSPLAADAVEAYQCGFHFCARTYDNISNINGTAVPPVSRQMPLVWRGENYVEALGPRNMITLGLASEKPYPDNLNDPYPEYLNFTINSADYSNLGFYLGELFTVGLLSRDLATDRANLAETNTPPIGLPLFKSQNISQTVTNISDSMSEAMRNGPNSTQALGEAWVYKTFVVVHWQWLALPVTLVTLTLALLITVILITSRMQVTPLKSSGLALLFHDLHGWHADETPMTNKAQLHEMSKEMVGKLDVSGLRPAFVKCE